MTEKAIPEVKAFETGKAIEAVETIPRSAPDPHIDRALDEAPAGPHAPGGRRW